ncbi:MAG: cytidylate kinase-like family protein [Muribaculaceae bacterium]|nr:cytidylate kinase-like family protein [Muribaculaceae bacterium]
MKKEETVIVIGREFGSGGRSVGRILADRLGVAYYDTELLKAAARSEGLREEVVVEHDERRPSLLKQLLQGLYGIPDNFHTVPLSGEMMHSVQSRVIRDLVGKGGCVIVGRAADVVLRDHPGLLSVFLHSPIERRVDRILERGEAKNRNEARDLALKHDRRRESFYNYFCGEKRWGVASNYHLSLDTSEMKAEEVADIIIGVAKGRTKSGG